MSASFQAVTQLLLAPWHADFDRRCPAPWHVSQYPMPYMTIPMGITSDGHVNGLSQSHPLHTKPRFSRYSQVELGSLIMSTHVRRSLIHLLPASRHCVFRPCSGFSHFGTSCAGQLFGFWHLHPVQSQLYGSFDQNSQSYRGSLAIISSHDLPTRSQFSPAASHAPFVLNCVSVHACEYGVLRQLTLSHSQPAQLMPIFCSMYVQFSLYPCMKATSSQFRFLPPKRYARGQIASLQAHPMQSSPMPPSARGFSSDSHVFRGSASISSSQVFVTPAPRCGIGNAKHSGGFGSQTHPRQLRPCASMAWHVFRGSSAWKSSQFICFVSQFAPPASHAACDARSAGSVLLHPCGMVIFGHGTSWHRQPAQSMPNSVSSCVHRKAGLSRSMSSHVSPCAASLNLPVAWLYACAGHETGGRWHVQPVHVAPCDSRMSHDSDGSALSHASQFLPSPTSGHGGKGRHAHPMQS